jgi:hypothetical protein
MRPTGELQQLFTQTLVESWQFALLSSAHKLSVALQQHYIGLLTLIGLFGGNSTGRREKISEKLAAFSPNLLVLASGVAQLKEEVTS